MSSLFSARYRNDGTTWASRDNGGRGEPGRSRVITYDLPSAAQNMRREVSTAADLSPGDLPSVRDGISSTRLRPL